MKKFILFVLLLLGILLFTAKYLIDRSMIFTGYAAKNLASGIFLADRTQEDLEKEDLNFSLVKYANSTVDHENRIVYSDFYGFGKQKAVYRDGLGVFLEEAGKYPDAATQGHLIVPAPEGFDTIYWPKGQKVRNNLSSVFDTEALNQAIDNAFKTGNTRSIVVAYDTLAFSEKYADGFDKDSRILGWSMSKSIASTMIGVLAKDGYINIDDPTNLLEWQDDERNTITTRHLLNMTSGLEWDEDYGDISPATTMLYEKSNHSEYAIDQELSDVPGTHFEYSSGSSNILTELVKRTINYNPAYWQFPYQEIFHKISMYNTVMETDASGNFVGSSYTYATTRDWARFGLLYLNEGIWFGDTIVKPDWVNFTKSAAPHSNGDYGSQFWLNQSGRELPDAPKDIFFADGYQGQRIYIIPSEKLVIVRMGLTKDKDFDYNKMVTEIIASLKK